jgi:hypothetical protein
MFRFQTQMARDASGAGIRGGVCTENLSSGVVVVKSAKDGV